MSFCYGALNPTPIPYTIYQPDHWVFEGLWSAGGKPERFLQVGCIGYECDGCDVEWVRGMPIASHRDCTLRILRFLVWLLDGCLTMRRLSIRRLFSDWTRDSPPGQGPASGNCGVGSPDTGRHSLHCRMHRVVTTTRRSPCGADYAKRLEAVISLTSSPHGSLDRRLVTGVERFRLDKRSLAG